VNGVSAIGYFGTRFNWGFSTKNNYFPGKVGIGTTTPVEKLVVESPSYFYVAQIKNSNTFSSISSGLKISLVQGVGQNHRFIGFFRNTAIIGAIVDNGGIQLMSVSDRRLKTNIENIQSALQVINAIQPRRYEYKTNLGTKEYGFIAQELQKVYPQAVSGSPDSNVTKNPMMVDYSRLTPILTAGIKELSNEIDVLKKENAELKKKVSKIELLEARITNLEKK